MIESPFGTRQVDPGIAVAAARVASLGMGNRNLQLGGRAWGGVAYQENVSGPPPGAERPRDGAEQQQEGVESQEPET